MNLINVDCVKLAFLCCSLIYIYKYIYRDMFPITFNRCRLKAFESFKVFYERYSNRSYCLIDYLYTYSSN